MKWIGLTGGIASGKTTVANRLRSKGFAVVDADDLARRAVDPGTEGLKRVAQVFGPDILRSDGSLDRAELGKRIFANPDLRRDLEAIIHPEVRRLSALERKRLESEGHSLAYYDVPLLFEKKMNAMFDAVIVVATTEDLQRQRLAKRNQLNAREIENRLRAQIPLAEKIKTADFVIENHGSLRDLERETDQVVIALQARLGLIR